MPNCRRLKFHCLVQLTLSTRLPAPQKLIPFEVTNSGLSLRSRDRISSHQIEGERTMHSMMLSDTAIAHFNLLECRVAVSELTIGRESWENPLSPVSKTTERSPPVTFARMTTLTSYASLSRATKSGCLVDYTRYEPIGVLCVAATKLL